MWAAFGRAEVFDLSPTGHRCSFPSPAVKVGRHATDKHDTEIYLACYRWVQYAAKRRCTDQKNELVLWPLAPCASTQIPRGLRRLTLRPTPIGRRPSQFR